MTRENSALNWFNTFTLCVSHHILLCFMIDFRCLQCWLFLCPLHFSSYIMILYSDLSLIPFLGWKDLCCAKQETFPQVAHSVKCMMSGSSSLVPDLFLLYSHLLWLDGTQQVWDQASSSCLHDTTSSPLSSPQTLWQFRIRKISRMITSWAQVPCQQCTATSPTPFMDTSHDRAD